jgi:hypothetical protein
MELGFPRNLVRQNYGRRNVEMLPVHPIGEGAMDVGVVKRLTREKGTMIAN